MSIFDKINEIREEDARARQYQIDKAFYEQVEKRLGLVASPAPLDRKDISAIMDYEPQSFGAHNVIRLGETWFFVENTAIEKLFNKIQKLKDKLEEEKEDRKEEIAHMQYWIDYWKGLYFEDEGDDEPKKKSKKSSKTVKNKKNVTKPEDIDLSEIPF